MIGAMETADGKWRVEVGGVGSVTWYRLVGDGHARTFPSLGALLAGVTAAGVDVADLREQTRDVVGSLLASNRTV
jgi:hypothetical protein